MATDCSLIDWLICNLRGRGHWGLKSMMTQSSPSVLHWSLTRDLLPGTCRLLLLGLQGPFQIMILETAIWREPSLGRRSENRAKWSRCTNSWSRESLWEKSVLQVFLGAWWSIALETFTILFSITKLSWYLLTYFIFKVLLNDTFLEVQSPAPFSPPVYSLLDILCLSIGSTNHPLEMKHGQ